MSEGKRSLISRVGNSNVKKWSFENENKKRRLEPDETSTSDSPESLFRLSQNPGEKRFTSTQHSNNDSDIAGSSKPKYVPKPFVGKNSFLMRKILCYMSKIFQFTPREFNFHTQ